jgi:hypothetical protein
MLTLPGERVLRRLQRKMRRDAILVELIRLGPRTVYGMLLAKRVERGFRHGWEVHAFKEIFGAPPRMRDWTDPILPNAALDRWFELRPKRQQRKTA